MLTPPEAPTRTILHARITVAERRWATQFLDDCVSTRTPARLAFVNANLACICARNPQVAKVLRGFTLLNDGIGINIASRLLHGRSFPANLNGTDFVPEYLGESTHRLRLFLLGGRPDVIWKARSVFEHRWPQHQIVGGQHGFFNEADAPSVAATIIESRADIVLVAMGNPRQEIWAAENVPGVAPVAICVGALFDFLAGEVSRAPGWVRTLRMEWAFRLMQEPARLWKRYTVDACVFGAHLLVQYVSDKRG